MDSIGENAESVLATSLATWYPRSKWKMNEWSKNFSKKNEEEDVQVESEDQVVLVLLAVTAVHMSVVVTAGVTFMPTHRSRK